MNSSIFLLLALSFVVLAHGRSYYQCQPCRGQECDVEPEDCKHGVTRDPCGRKKCMAGPGELCGGRDNHLGKCGNGMTCDCKTCTGCSSDLYDNFGILKCFEKTTYMC